MAKRINQLNETTTITDNNYFAIDSFNTDGQTNKVTFQTIKNTLSNSLVKVNNCTITTDSTFKYIHYDNMHYIAGGCYTQAYIATRLCIVFWHIEWDCAGNDGLYMLIIDGSGNVKGEITIMRDAELNDSIWMNRNGLIPLGPGMGIRFRGINAFNTRSGNLLSYLVAFLDK